MILPRFSMKQLLISVSWICIGLGGIAFSGRHWNWNPSLRPSDDWHADAQPVVRITARVVGGVLICMGIIPLVTKRRPMRVLILALCGAMAGLFISAFVLVPQSGYQSDDYRMTVVYTAIVIGAAAAILLAAVTPSKKDHPTRETQD